MTIIANTMLVLQGEADSSLDQENQSAAENICKSFESFRHLKPLGASAVVLILSAAYGVSDAVMREKIAEEYQDLLERVDPIPGQVCGLTMQFVFDTLTGVPTTGND